MTRRWRWEATDVPAKPSLRKIALKQAGKKETELAAATAVRDVADVTWEDFRTRYAQEHLASLRPRTRSAFSTAAEHFERIANPYHLAEATGEAMSRFAASLRRGVPKKKGEPLKAVAETTIACYLRTLLAGFAWAVEMDLLEQLPAVRLPKLAKGKTKRMRSRPITAEEYERMLASVVKIRPKDPAPWTNLITGLWLSGLRIGEACALSWDFGTAFGVSMEGRFPCYVIHGEGQKSGEDQLLPMAPEFATFLHSRPERQGRVFPLPVSDHRAQRIIAAIGKAAGVRVASAKTATAHDLRRSFGTRWASRVSPAELQVLMRHKSIETTMAYYVQLDTDDLAAKLWRAVEAQAGALRGAPAPREPSNQVAKEP